MRWPLTARTLPVEVHPIEFWGELILPTGRLILIPYTGTSGKLIASFHCHLLVVRPFANYYRRFKSRWPPLRAFTVYWKKVPLHVFKRDLARSLVIWRSYCHQVVTRRGRKEKPHCCGICWADFWERGHSKEAIYHQKRKKRDNSLVRGLFYNSVSIWNGKRRLGYFESCEVEERKV